MQIYGGCQASQFAYKIVDQTSGGGSVLSGNTGGQQVKVRSKSSNVLIVHCYSRIILSYIKECNIFFQTSSNCHT